MNSLAQACVSTDHAFHTERSVVVGIVWEQGWLLHANTFPSYWKLASTKTGQFE